MEKELDDIEIFQLIQQGDKQAFTIVYKRYYGILYHLAFKYLKDQAMAEDALHHVFSKLLENPGRITITTSLKNYLYTMTKNHVLNQIRNHNNAVVRNYEIAQMNGVEDHSMSEMMEQKEVMTLFSRAIDLLPVQKKRVCQLKLAGDMSNQEIADEMNISIFTVKTHYMQSVKMLRDYMIKSLAFLTLYITLFK